MPTTFLPFARRLAGAMALGLAAVAASAAETLALPGGVTLTLQRQALVLADAQGRTLERLALRAKHVDQRRDGAATLLALLDADSGRPLLLRIDDAAPRLQRLPALPPPDFDVQALCLYRDGQQQLQLFLLGNEGLGAQWLLGGAAAAQPLRRLASALHPSQCRVDDTTATLYVAEPGVGLWAQRAEAEGRPQRRLLSTSAAWPEGALPPAPWPAPDALPVVRPRAQTASVAQFGDAADDPAIWRHPRDARRSRVLGTNKKQGLLVYDLDGRQRQLLPVGRLNNVDLRQGLRIGGRVRDLAVATRREDNTLVLFDIAADGRVSELARLPTGLDEIYGVCAARTPRDGLDVFVNDKDGRLQHYAIERAQGAWRARLLRQWRLASQPEGCVVDDARQRLFIGEEKRGIWAVAAGADQPTTAEPVLMVGGALQADVEGLGLVQGPGADYLVVSSQGSDSFVVLDAAPPYAPRGSFRIGLDAARGLDGVSETDGLAASAADFGSAYRGGLLVVQDGHKRLPDGPQNFKLVPWAEVKRALGL